MDTLNTDQPTDTTPEVKREKFRPTKAPKKPIMHGCNIRPGMVPGGFTRYMQGNSRDGETKRSHHGLGERANEIREAARAVLEGRTNGVEGLERLDEVKQVDPLESPAPEAVP